MRSLESSFTARKHPTKHKINQRNIGPSFAVDRKVMMDGSAAKTGVQDEGRMVKGLKAVVIEASDWPAWALGKKYPCLKNARFLTSTDSATDTHTYVPT
jgi:hypothetical protein